MKKILYLSVFAAILSAGCAFADGNAFTPLNFDDTAYSVPNTTNTIKTTSNTANNSAASGIVNTSNAISPNVTGNADLQSAIAKIDTALESIKSEQSICKSKFADVDNQYKFIKNERSNLKKQIRANERRINDLSKAKIKLGNNLL